MRISGTEPSSAIISQKSSFESWKDLSQKCLNKLKPKVMQGSPCPGVRTLTNENGRYNEIK